MKIKTKLTLGVGLLFLLIILLSLVGVRNINALKQDTEYILVANYNSVEYARYMLSSLEDNTTESLKVFEEHLHKQEKNITEIGEQAITQEVRNNFDNYKKNTLDSTLRSSIRKGIFTLMDLNMQAIQRKSEIAKTTAKNAMIWIPVTGTLCFLIAFTLLINLPSSIANPIKELTQSTKEIAANNYSQRVHFQSNSEFGELAKSFNTMAVKLEEYNNSNLAKLMMEKTRIETLINNMHDPVIGLDENLKIIFVNEEATKIIGIDQQRLMGHSAQELAVHNDLIRELIKDLIVEGSPINNKITPIKIYANNKEGYFDKEILHISITPTGEEKKRLIGHVIVLRNITEYKELDYAKTNFIATVSHEFKTPISAIKMSLQLLENKQIGILNNEQINLVESIKEDTNRLLKITGELLNMTQVESGNIQLSILPADAKEIITYAVSANKVPLEQKRIKLETDYGQDIPLIQADAEKTSWVLTNLLSNAIRYSHENSSIFIKLMHIDKKLKISITDTGQGISPQYKNKIFDRYFRIPGSNETGTGLGLAISKEFMEAQGGAIEVESELGAGSTFTITLNTM
ncbi:MAG: HAMP domain-containing protein [Bacteroidetes bacterium]|nr:HAMP domain-containing protein [Bacteroidota bacterium]